MAKLFNTSKSLYFIFKESIAYRYYNQNKLDKKREFIVSLFDQLLQVERSDMILLNRIYAYSKATSQLEALTEVEKLPMMQNQFYFLLLGYLYTTISASKALSRSKNAIQHATTKD